jgi:hypothetical protein
MDELIELIKIFVEDDKRLLCQFLNQLTWVIFPAVIKWQTDKLVIHGYTKARLEATCGNN